MHYIVPDFLYWINKTFKNNFLNRDFIRYSPELNWNENYKTSLISLLFNESYDSTTYDYLYQPNDVLTQWDKTLLTRGKIFSDTIYLDLVPNNTSGMNLFNIESDDILILDKLLEYRLDPANTTLDGITFDRDIILNYHQDQSSFKDYEKDNTELISPPPEINNKLFVLIYIYLDYKINNDKSLYDNLIIFTKDNGNTPREILEYFYETYLINVIFENFIMTHRL